MSRPILSTPSSSRPSNPQDGLIPSSGGRDPDDLAIKIEQQRAKIRAFKLAAQKRRQTDQLRIQEQAQTKKSWRQELYQRLVIAVSTKDRHVLFHQQEEQRRKDRQVQEEADTQALLSYKASVVQDVDNWLQQRGVIFNQQEEQCCKNRLAQDESAIQAQEAKERKLAEESKLAKIRKKEQLAEECRLILVKIKEREQKQLLARQQENQCCREMEARDQACLQAFECYKAATKARKQKQLLARQQEDRRRQEREAWDQACLQALERYKAAAKARKAQEAEQRKLAKLREAEERRLAKLRKTEQKKKFRNQEKELQQIEKQKQDNTKKEAGLHYKSAVQTKKEKGNLLREQVERQRNKRSLGVVQRQAVHSLQEEVRRRDREKQDDAGRQAIQYYKAALQAQKVL